MKDEMTRAAVNHIMLKRLGHMYDRLYEVELAKSELELEELFMVGFFIQQFAKLRTLELYHNILKKFC